MAAAEKAYEEKRHEAGDKNLLAAVALIEGIGPRDPRYFPALEIIASAFGDAGNKIRQEFVVRRIVDAKAGQLGPNHPDLAADILRLAFLQRELSRHAEAADATKRALEIRTAALGSDHPDTVHARRDLAHLYLSLRRFAEAEDLFRALVWLQGPGTGMDDAIVAHDLESLAQIYRARGWLQDAEQFSEQAESLREQTPDPDDARAAWKVRTEAEQLAGRRQFAEAEPFYLRWLEIEEKHSDSPHSNLIPCLTELSRFYRAWGREPEAREYFQRALEMQEKKVRVIQAGPANHAEATMQYANLGALHMQHGRFAEAEQAYRMLIDIERKMSSAYPSMSLALCFLASSVCAQARLDEAEELFKEGRRLAERAVGDQHQDVIHFKNMHAKCYRRTGRHAAAEALYLETLSQKETGKLSTEALAALLNTLSEYVALLRETGRKDEAQAAQRRANSLARRFQEQNSPD